MHEQLVGWQHDVAPEALYVRMARGRDAPALGRAAVAEWSEGLPLEPDVSDLLRLLVSELVTNAVRHSAGTRITLAGLLSDDQILVTVTDSGVGELPVAREPDLARGGYGLHLVDTFAREWGVERAEDTRVWFTMPVRAPGSA
jgi:anti-sigma regulatory factor (Ser/Thr protein kinase)